MLKEKPFQESNQKKEEAPSLTTAIAIPLKAGINF
jgi:hypothetical protein